MSINRPLLDMAGKRDEEAALAGNILYNSFNSENVDSFNQSYVVPPPVEVMEDPHVTKCCRMSAVRRTFCLVVVFDLILTFILWLLYTELNNNLEANFTQLALGHAFDSEVLDYQFKSSMFDIVWMACVRFFILILSYALYRSRTPWLVAVSTFLTCAYVLVKLFLYDWTSMVPPTTPPPKFQAVGTTHSSNTPSDVSSTLKYLLIILLVISSLVLAWVEVWLMDFRVLPLEQRARERASLIHHTTYSERTPLLHDTRSTHDYQSDRFYSPYESRAGSDDEDEGRFKSARGSRGHSRNASSVETIYTAQELEYIKSSKEGLERVWLLSKQEDGWKEESGNNLQTGIVSTIQIPNVGKVFKLTGIIELPPKDVFEEIVFNFENQLSWNNTVTAAEIIHRVNESCDVTYNVAAEAMGGMVSTRDFVNVRTWITREGSYVMGGVNAEHPAKPVFKEHIRAENKLGAWIARPYEGDKNRTEFIWISNVNLKGWLPQSLIDQALSGVMKDFLKNLQGRCSQIREELYGPSEEHS